MLGSVVQDVRFALRLFVRSPGFVVVALVSLSLGMGAGTAIFTLASALLLRPLPVDEPERLVRLHATWPDGSSYHSFSYLDYLDLRAQSTAVLGGLAAEYSTLVSEGEEGQTAFANVVTRDYFDVLGIEAQHGAAFRGEPGAGGGGDAVVVLGHRYWQRRFGGDPRVVGRELELNGYPFIVAGIAPEGFTGTYAGLDVDLYAPMAQLEVLNPGTSLLRERQALGLELIGRLEPGVSIEGARSAVETLVAGLRQAYPGVNEGHGVELLPASGLPAAVRAPVAVFLGTLLGVVGLVLLIAGTNVATVLLARSVGRRREMAVRSSLGASREQIVRQLLTETLLLFAAAGLLGLGIAQLLGRLLLSIELPIPVPIALDLGADLRVVLFGLLVALGSGFLFGLAPALQSSSLDVAGALKQGEGSKGRSRLRSAFVVAQVALTLILLVAAGLFLRALGRAASLDPGFEPRGVHLLTLDLSLHGYDVERALVFYDAFLERVRALPDVESAALADFFPLALGNQVLRVNVEGVEPPEGLDGFAVDFVVVSDGYLEAMGIPLVAGRGVEDGDRSTTRPVAVVNQAMAHRFWPEESPLGRHFVIGDDGEGAEPVEVVGVARTTSVRRLGEAPRPQLYLPLEQSYANDAMTLHLRARGEPSAAINAVRAELRSLDPAVAVADVSTFEEMIGLSLLPQRLAAAVSGSLGVVGLLLAALGVYGTTAYVLSQRRRELGLRLALGSTRSRLLALVLRQGGGLVLIGVVAGLGSSALLSRLLAGLLYGLDPLDPVTFAGVTSVLGSSALLAVLVPAWRAARIDPSRALRYE